MKWTSAEDQRLLLVVLDIHKIDHAKVAARWAEKYGRLKSWQNPDSYYPNPTDKARWTGTNCKGHLGACREGEEGHQRWQGTTVNTGSIYSSSFEKAGR